MLENIGEVKYKEYSAQKCEIRKDTEKNINSLFERSVISSEQRDNLMSLYLSGDLNFGSDGLTEEEAANFTQENYEEITQSLNSDTTPKNKTLYIIQAGDTPLKIAEKMGFSGDEAKDFAEKIKDQAIQDGVYYKYGFKVGDMITLDGDYQDKINELKQNGEYYDSDEEINNNYNKVIEDKRAEQAAKSRRTSETPRSKSPDAPPATPKAPSSSPKPVKKSNPANMNAAQSVKKSATEIVTSLKNKPTPTNPDLKKITPNNVVFVLLLYNQSNGRYLARDLINNGDKNFANVKNQICYKLVTRAKQLNVPGIYFGDYLKIKNANDLIKWIENAKTKLLDAEIKNNPAIAEVFPNTQTKQVHRKSNLGTIQKNAKKLAQDLHGAIEPKFEWGLSKGWDWVKKNTSNDDIIAALKNVKPETAAFVVSEYKKLSNKTITKAIAGEIGLDINYVKKYICINLVARAKQDGIHGVYHSDYQKIKDLDTLDKWVEKISAKIRAVETNSAPDVVFEEDKGIKKTTETKNGVTEITTTAHPLFKKAGITKTVDKVDDQGYKIERMYYYKDGKEVKENYTALAYDSKTKKFLTLKDVTIAKDKDGKYRAYNSKGVSYQVQEDDDGKFIEVNKTKYYIKTKRSLVKAGTTPKPAKTNITEPVPLKITLPSNANSNAKKFAKALEDNKAMLMELLHIDSDTYNKLAITAMSIAEQETNFGSLDSPRAVKYPVAAIDTIAGVVLTKNGINGAINPLRALSYGPTQLKYSLHVQDADIKALFENKNVGIVSGVQLYKMENSAKATMIVLAKMYQRMQGSNAAQNGLKAAEGAIVEENGFEIKNGHAIKTYNTRPWVNEVTEEDALCSIWNSGSMSVMMGAISPEANIYCRNTRKYREKYGIKEDPAARERAIEISRMKQNSRGFTPMDNNGPIGSVVFMPKMYSYSDINQTEALKTLRASLAKNDKIKEDSKKQLIAAVEHGVIGFEFGLSAKEADSLTQKDVDMLLKHSKTVQQQVKNVNFSDGVDAKEAKHMRDNYMTAIRNAELNFKKEYLASKSPIVSISNVSAANVLNTPMNNPLNHAKSKTRRGFVGSVDGSISDLGVNKNNTSDASVALAKSAQKVAKRTNTSGWCMTAFRKALNEVGIDTSFLTASKPREAVNCFLAHPDMFEEVKYINIGGGKARQINSTDIPNLPAGYIAIWVPDQSNSNFAKLEGHTSITSGNGQAYADEVDNCDWGVFHSSSNAGKGEHGTIRVFRLTNKWQVGPDGKLVFKG